MKYYDHILFDLDGTLIESAAAVEQSLAYAMEQLRLPCPDLSDYTRYVGPPLEDTMRGMCAVPEELVGKALTLYRAHYDDIMLSTNRLFDGVTEMLLALKEQGRRLAVCTSKNEAVALDVTEKLGLRRCLDAVCGSAADGSRKAKADLIPYALAALGCEDKTSAVMVGDTHFDARGAQLTGVDFVGVTYGYGTVSSMEACGSVGFADSPSALLRLLTDCRRPS